MPNPSIWPLVCATGMLIMFSGLLFMDSNTPLAITIMLSGTAVMVGSLYKWLTTPLEDHH